MKNKKTRQELLNSVLESEIIKKNCDTYRFIMDGSVTFTEKGKFSLTIFFATKTNWNIFSFWKIENKKIYNCSELYVVKDNRTIRINKEELLNLIVKIRNLESDTSNKFLELIDGKI